MALSSEVDRGKGKRVTSVVESIFLFRMRSHQDLVRIGGCEKEESSGTRIVQSGWVFAKADGDILS